MTAPEKVKSGIEGLDRALSNIRLGDNVVWRLKSLDLFPLVAAPLRQAGGIRRAQPHLPALCTA